MTSDNKDNPIFEEFRNLTLKQNTNISPVRGYIPVPPKFKLSETFIKLPTIKFRQCIKNDNEPYINPMLKEMQNFKPRRVDYEPVKIEDKPESKKLVNSLKSELEFRRKKINDNYNSSDEADDWSD